MLKVYKRNLPKVDEDLFTLLGEGDIIFISTSTGKSFSFKEDSYGNLIVVSTDDSRLVNITLVDSHSFIIET